jgi:hypothetical protein
MELRIKKEAQFYYIIFYIKPVYLPFPLSIKFQQAKPDKGQTWTDLSYRGQRPTPMYCLFMNQF